MAKSANVRSLESLRELRVALIKFIDKAKRAISTSDSEVSHMKIWIESNQPTHWIRQIRKGEELLNQAKSELFRATLSQPDNPRGPTDQVRLVRRRKEEIEFAKKKLEQTKRWSRTYERSANEYRGSISPLSSSLDGSALKAVAIIERSISTLEQYLSTVAPSLEPKTSTTTSTSPSISRKGEEETEQNENEHANRNSPVNESDQSPDVPMEPDE